MLGVFEGSSLKKIPLEVWIYWRLIGKESLRLHFLKADTL